MPTIKLTAVVTAKGIDIKGTLITPSKDIVGKTTLGVN